MEPLLLKPVGKDNLWGGNKLKNSFSKDLNVTPLAETWECSVHPDGPSTIVNGEFAGMTLDVVLKDNTDFLGDRVDKSYGLPILVKFIDAEQDLSLQVHPDDEFARINENDFGKNEMWYVLEATNDASLVHGFAHNVNEVLLKQAIDDGSLDKHLNKVSVNKGDVFYTSAGTIHGIGAGCLIAEIQESSNVTYRVYDYNRLDKNGNKRELHFEKALKVLNMNATEKYKQKSRLVHYYPGCSREILCRCKYFQVERLLINTERQREMTTFKGLEHTFQVLLCTEGCGVLFPENGTPIPVFKGDCIFIPAQCVPITLHGKMHFLTVTC